MARQATARFTRGLSGWLSSALPGVVIDPPDEDRGRRDRLVDATMYAVAFAIGAATLVDIRVAGNFPGSPVELHHHFTVSNERITALTICP